MRTFKNVDKQRQIALTKQFPDLLEVVEGDAEGYTYLAVSVYDRWLGPEDSMRLIDHATVEEKQERNALLRAFSHRVLSETEVVDFRFKGKWQRPYVKFRGFTSEDVKKKHFEPAVACVNKGFFCVVLPELDAVFMENYDDTNVFFLRDLSKEKIIRQWAAECGIFCLER